MARKYNKKPYGKRETNALMKISPSDPKRRELIKAHAIKFGRSNDVVYQQHKRLHLKSTVKRVLQMAPVVATRKKVVAVAAANDANIVPYVLETGADMGQRTEFDMLKDRLKPLIEAMDVYDPNTTRHAVPVYTVKTSALRGWLTSDPSFKNKQFRIEVITGNKEMSRIFRKA